jgi:Fe-S-cluster containining protein
VSACIHCGECCRTMSPLCEDPEHQPCPHLQMSGTIAVCAIYARRPQRCRDHDYAFASVCPIGRDVLKINDADYLAAREHEIDLVLCGPLAKRE